MYTQLIGIFGLHYHDGTQQGKLKSRKTGMEWKQKVGMRTTNR